MKDTYGASQQSVKQKDYQNPTHSIKFLTLDNQNEDNNLGSIN